MSTSMGWECLLRTRGLLQHALELAYDSEELGGVRVPVDPCRPGRELRALAELDDIVRTSDLSRSLIIVAEGSLRSYSAEKRDAPAAHGVLLAVALACDIAMVHKDAKATSTSAWQRTVNPVLARHYAKTVFLGGLEDRLFRNMAAIRSAILRRFRCMH